MTTGLRALAQAIKAETSDIRIAGYAGQFLFSGRLGTYEGFHAVSRRVTERRATKAVEKVRKDEERSRKYEEITEFPLAVLEWAQNADQAGGESADEFTLVDVEVFPAVGTTGTKSGGQWLPAIRIPYSAVDMWWLVEGDEIPGKSASSGGFAIGAVFPLE